MSDDTSANPAKMSPKHPWRKSLYVYFIRHSESSNNAISAHDVIVHQCPSDVQSIVAPTPEAAETTGTGGETGAETGDEKGDETGAETTGTEKGAAEAGAAAGAEPVDETGTETGAETGAETGTEMAETAFGGSGAGSGAGRGGGQGVARGRVADPCLTERGQLQAESAARLFQNLARDPDYADKLKPKRIFTSLQTRAVMTCRPIAEALGLLPEAAIQVHEAGGVFDGPRANRGKGLYLDVHGLTRVELLEILPNLMGTEGLPDERGWWRGGIETLDETCSRAWSCTEWLWSLAEDLHPGEESAVAIITHGLFLDVLLKAIMGLEPKSRRNLFLTANGAYWLLGFHVNEEESDVKRQTVVMASNVVDHVPMPIRTGHCIKPHGHTQPSYPPFAAAPADASGFA
eukprot:NODE_7762_length_1552_cov_6.409123.p1 GENE.NODE_7762_length_1552_cov_6.409123~~NODE_7762_length_1552_cov_6.409123.p1  ORF type:complete len:404 (+),score=73.90 NODE_7762_length_1552_cov_6.409123:271-1482(+)